MKNPISLVASPPFDSRRALIRSPEFPTSANPLSISKTSGGLAHSSKLKRNEFRAEILTAGVHPQRDGEASCPAKGSPRPAVRSQQGLRGYAKQMQEPSTCALHTVPPGLRPTPERLRKAERATIPGCNVHPDGAGRRRILPAASEPQMQTERETVRT